MPHTTVMIVGYTAAGKEGLRGKARARLCPWASAYSGLRPIRAWATWSRLLRLMCGKALRHRYDPFEMVAKLCLAKLRRSLLKTIRRTGKPEAFRTSGGRAATPRWPLVT